MNEVKLPPLPDIPAAICPWDHSEGVVKNLLEAYAAAAIEADRQARGEPVAWEYLYSGDWIRTTEPDVHAEKGRKVRALYTAPQPAEPVKVDGKASVPSDEAIQALAKQYDCHLQGFMGFARALLARYAQPADPSGVQDGIHAAQPQQIPEGYKLVPDYKVGMRVKFKGMEYDIFAKGDRPGTFDICLPNRISGDRWLNVPPDALEMLKPAPEVKQ